MSKEFIYDDEGRLVRGSITRNPGAKGHGDSNWADELRRREDEIRSTYRDDFTSAVKADEHGAFPFGEDNDINAAADFINDATQDLPRDKFAAVLQAAIARRD